MSSPRQGQRHACLVDDLSPQVLVVARTSQIWKETWLLSSEKATSAGRCLSNCARLEARYAQNTESSSSCVSIIDCQAAEAGVPSGKEQLVGGGDPASFPGASALVFVKMIGVQGGPVLLQIPEFQAASTSSSQTSASHPL